MGSLIHDAFTALPLSRQRKYQLRRRTEGRCWICGDPAPDERCDYHHIEMALSQLRRRGEVARPRRGKWLVLAGIRDSQ